MLLLSYAISQPVVTDASNKRIMQWDFSYQVETKSFRADFDYKISYHYTIRKQSKLIAEYFRHDDTSYLFISYDMLGRRKQRGLIRLCNEAFDSTIIQVPDFGLDPTFSKGVTKDSLLFENSYRKNGLWWEKDSSNNIWKGFYKNGLKEGIWKEGTLVCCNETAENINDALYDLFKPRAIHIYKNGIEQFDNEGKSFWPQISGNWYHESLIDSNILITRKSSFGRPLFCFETATKFSSYRKPKKPRFSDDMEKYTASWNQHGDTINIKENGNTQILQVLGISDKELIIKFISWK
jgi:hypothetical protein